MTSLLDIGPLTEEVEIRGNKLTVQGLTAGHLFQLFAEFPDMRNMLRNKEGNAQSIMLGLAPDLIAKIIAIATGSPGNKEVEEKAKSMGAADQMTIMAAVQQLSFPDGIGPFVERVTKLMTSTAVGLQSRLPVTDSANSSEPQTKSPAPFSASLQTDTPASLRGVQRRVN